MKFIWLWLGASAVGLLAWVVVVTWIKRNGGKP